jgi:hypothetical protein
MMPRPPCGTRAGYAAHRKLGEVACSPCRAAAAKYQRDRRTDVDARQVDYARKNARERALTRLAQAHPEEYRALYVEETGHLTTSQGRG